MTTISGNTSPTTYIWSNGATTSSISGLSPGNYLLNIVDGNGCTFSGTYNIDAYVCTPFAVNGTVTDAICYDDCNGAIQLNALSNGSTAFSALWNEGQSTNILNDLCAATYQVTVTDSDNCTATNSFVVDQPNEITITIDSVRNFTAVDSGAVFFTIDGLDPSMGTSCEGCVVIPGAANICNACGGLGNFTFVDNLPPGQGIVTITLNNGCQIFSAPFTISYLSSNKDFVNTPFKVFPNPANEILNIATIDGSYPKEIVLKNIFGVIVGRYYNTHSIDVSNLQSGLYFVNLYNEDFIYTRPFTVQH
jgi:Secretion system C-terminal sorting domain